MKNRLIVTYKNCKKQTFQNVSGIFFVGMNPLFAQEPKLVKFVLPFIWI